MSAITIGSYVRHYRGRIIETGVEVHESIVGWETKGLGMPIMQGKGYYTQDLAMVMSKSETCYVPAMDYTTGKLFVLAK